jgi:competence protein ComEC
VKEVTSHTGYDVGGAPELHPGLDGRAVTGDLAIVAMAAVVVVAVRTREPMLAGVGALWCVVVVPAVRRAGPRWAAVALLLVAASVWRSEAGWAGLEPDELGLFTGWVEIVTDPQPYAASTRVILEIDGERFETWSRGRAQQQRVMRWRGGEWVRVSGERQALEGDRARRVASQHVVGRFDLEWASDVAPGRPLARASNRIRSAIERSSAFIAEPHDALFRGLVIGDDRDQPREMIDRFRASGLSHLTAVSGQNVAFVLAACSPLLVRLRPWPRWLLTVGVIAWFVAITRFEPSILRAGVMAGLSATAFVSGRERSPVRLLALAVIGLSVIDPLLLWSVGFWLSVGATGGVCTIGPWLARHFARLGGLALPLGVTLGAQVGVAIPSILVFGRLPLVSVAANLLAVPVAGLVMLYGLPAGLLVGVVPGLGPVLMAPAAVGTRWVDTVAMLGARLEPGPPWSFVGWGVIVVVVVAVLVRARFRRS